jgi:hypothetical protein
VLLSKQGQMYAGRVYTVHGLSSSRWKDADTQFALLKALKKEKALVK